MALNANVYFMPPKTLQPISTPNHFVIKLPKKVAYILVSLVVLAGAGGFYWYNHSSTKTTQAPQLYKYSYSQLSNYTLGGASAGDGMSFSRPVELGGSKDLKAGGTSINFDQSVSKNSQNIDIAKLNATSVTYKTSPQYIKSVAAAITNPQSSSYNTILAPIKQFVAAGVGYNYAVTFSTPVALTTSNFKSNAWSLDFTAKPFNSAINPLLPNMQGKAVFAIGKKTYYYFFVSAVDYNWQANQSVFGQVISSLKIDQ